MAVLVQLLNGTNLVRDAGFQAEKTAILDPGVRKNYSGELTVTTNSVAAGMCFIKVTRDVVTPNEVFLIPVIVTVATTIDTSGNGYVIVRIAKSKVNDGSANATDGSGVATVEKVTSLPATDPYLVLATLSSGVITDGRTWTQISENVIDQEFYYDEDAQVTDAYSISVTGFKGYRDGKRFSFKANTANTGAATFAISGFPAKSIRRMYSTPLVDGDIVAGQIVDLVYDADNDWFQMQNPAGSQPGVPSKASTAEAQAGVEDTKFMTALKTFQAFATRNVAFAENADGSTTPVVVANQGNMRKSAKLYSGSIDWMSQSYQSFGNADANTRAGQGFIWTDPTAVSIALVDVMFVVKTVGNPSDSVYVEVRNDDGSGQPGGTVIATSNSVSAFSISGTKFTVFTFPSPPAITSGTKYHYTLRRSGANDAVNYYSTPYSSLSLAPGVGLSTYTASSGIWSTASAIYDLYYIANFDISYGGKFVKGQAGDANRRRVCGFLKSNVTAGNNAYVQFAGVVSGFTGLIPGNKYYLSATAGQITDSPTADSIPVGSAISATELLIDFGQKIVSGTGIGVSKISGNTSIITIPIETGIKPGKIDLTISLGDGTTSGVAQLQAVKTFGRGGWYIQGSGSFSVSAVGVNTNQAQIANVTASISAITENGFVVQVNFNTSAAASSGAFEYVVSE